MILKNNRYKKYVLVYLDVFLLMNLPTMHQIYCSLEGSLNWNSPWITCDCDWQSDWGGAKWLYLIGKIYSKKLRRKLHKSDWIDYEKMYYIQLSVTYWVIDWYPNKSIYYSPSFSMKYNYILYAFLNTL